MDREVVAEVDEHGRHQRIIRGATTARVWTIRSQLAPTARKKWRKVETRDTTTIIVTHMAAAIIVVRQVIIQMNVRIRTSPVVVLEEVVDEVEDVVEAEEAEVGDKPLRIQTHQMPHKHKLPLHQHKYKE